MFKRNLLLLAAVIALAIGPLMYHGTNAEFGGSDGQAEEMITQIQPDYQPWAAPLWEPPSGEIESLLFALQAALGAGLLGYYFGRRRGLAEATDESPDRATHRP
ncbi:energy-coupling factor ABC transporter substrate-binding protein [Dongia mobilis]|jgi:cobalt/nickel transport protein|uniref:energy-coupling factor ABC transporter substrate-binding protein n=1 Tax=Dongia sp. TaxID=1977262 RepID=UPI0026EDDB3A